MGFERHHSTWILASVITVASFVGATAYSQNRLARLDALSSQIEREAIPSIYYLSEAGVQLTRLNQLVDEVATPGPRRESALPATRREVAELNANVDRYIQLTLLQEEGPLRLTLRTDIDNAERLIDETLHDPPTGEPSSPPPTAAQLDDALDIAAGAVAHALAFDVKHSEGLAHDVRDVRVKTLHTIEVLDGLATVLALGAVFVAHRGTRRHDRLVDEHNALLTARVTELDRFAGRVAHDVLNPLSAIAAGLSLLERSADKREHVYIERSQRAVERVQQLVDGLLNFARSGARPNGSSSCSMDSIVRNVLTDCAEPAEEKGIELVVDVRQRVRVPCAPGVVTSIVENLVRNAIKYMGTRPTRKVLARTTIAGDVARLEVEDTGPGIPTNIEATLFEPFVRGPDEHVNGTGLGLATVKRLVESHGGKVGVESKAGMGSVFWVELPLAPDQSKEAVATSGTQSV
jgi:signal transduction histidine kinase